MNEFKRVLVCCPTAAVKNYCWPQWIENVMKFTYPNFEIRLFDNTDDNGVNAQYLNNYFRAHFGQNDKFAAINSLKKHNYKSNSIIAKMCLSHNDCRAYALANKYDFILHLESDVFPPTDIIERLIFHGKNVTGAIYFIDEGRYRSAMVMERLELSPNHITTYRSSYYGGEIRLFDGGLHQVAQVGLGCVLISNKVLQRIPFRYEPNRNCHPDTQFSEDCAMQKIPINLDTSAVCKHENQRWGLYGVNFT